VKHCAADVLHKPVDVDETEIDDGKFSAKDLYLNRKHTVLLSLIMMSSGTFSR